MDIVQKFYDNMAKKYDKLFSDWNEATREEAEILDRIFKDEGFGKETKILDCACGIGTQAIGLAGLGYNVTASDISEGEISEAEKRAKERGVEISFARADFRTLSDTFNEKFKLIIAMDNALPHMLTLNELEKAVKSISGCLEKGGMFAASIRDYDVLLKEKPPYSPPYIHKTENGRRVSFQIWDWEGDNYCLTQYIIEDGEEIETSKFSCEYRAVRRDELTKLLINSGCDSVEWKFPEETGFYQPIVIAKKSID
ncbi:MAG: class I SAM-dependent methyltransferase [Clostridia bacterium]|nr:class I SAM-dependent methyltransferase [Clostridia bacterium]